VQPHPDDELALGPAGEEAHRQLQVWHSRGLTAAKLAMLAGITGVVFLCLSGLKPPALAIPLFMVSVSLLFAAASAALFAWVAYLQMVDADPDSDDDGGGPGGGSDEPPEPPRDGGLEFDWQRFEHDFLAYCDRPVPVEV
jgi:hypothetical protein